jgi:hypothetical protein
MSAQPFRGAQKVVLEKRDPTTGALDFTGEQPPVGGMTFDTLYDLFFLDNLDSGPSAGWPELCAWLDAKGWRVRAKTW